MIPAEKRPVLEGLAAPELPLRRPERYRGEGFGVPLHDLAPLDVERLYHVYDEVKRIYDLWLWQRQDLDPAILARRIVVIGSLEFVETVSAIGQATHALHGSLPNRVRQALHDCRGGALTALHGYCEVFGTSLSPEMLQAVVYLARDHAKIMRNALPELDPLVYQADEGIRVHEVDDIIAKFSRIHYPGSGGEVALRVFAEFHGAISSRCLEASAIDRILYNLLNNAARFAADGAMALYILPLERGLVRWVVENGLAEEQQAWLRQQVGDDLGDLFAGGITHGGSGIGLASCRDFVQESFGLTAPTEAIDGGYLGAKVIGDRFYAWFHWPEYQN